MTATTTETDAATLDRVLQAAADAAPVLAETSAAERAGALRGIADALDRAAEELVALAEEESHLPNARLTGEVGRTTGQLRMFAQGLEGPDQLLDVIIDTADPDANPVPRPDLRRMQLPIGPVLVFAASNFPFAFSVAGGDTASALAAGCPVVVKAHPGHPRTSERTAEVVSQAVAEAGLPEGAFALIQGQEAGVTALKDERLRAGSFTGSEAGGRFLYGVAAERETPIPFYAEMGSLNPVFVTPGAVEARGSQLADGYLGSFTLGVGQFCTKPGLLFLPRGSGLVDELVDNVAAAQAGPMLNERIHQGHSTVLDELAERPGIRVLHRGAVDAEGGTAAPTLLATDVASLLEDRDAMLTECFGPTSIVVEYDDTDQALEAARAFAGSLTATVHAQEDEAEQVQPLLHELRERAGRVLWNGWPTGVAVSWAQHHGGPYPATTAPSHTSVGMTAIRRFQRPVVFQDVPDALLPEPLRDANPGGLLRRVNGELTTEDVTR
ncbi:aldehyde dehydrogenase (NADP(+)) [Ornithinicoccus halotolerans]|uniref:aldehyde dehydrogenase (NADP(+)) n=1 Tax=Ornithinicoccus halotolerans TaxID=1748220 RepID=UPI0012953338|nr:aldehyde dehydrogenase (NADP(+)) [Ornithinicoccus halotolerans]